jgi:hypothetical protein
MLRHRDAGLPMDDGRPEETPVAKKLAIWKSCHPCERMPSSNPAGTCHPIRAATGRANRGPGYARTRRSDRVCRE